MSELELNLDAASAAADELSKRKRKRSLWERRVTKKAKQQAVKQKRQQPAAPRAQDLLKGYDLSGASLQPRIEPPAEPSPSAAKSTAPEIAAVADQSEDEGADIAAAIQASKQQDAAFRDSVPAESGESDDADRQAGVVHFPGAYQPHHPKLKQSKPAKPKPKGSGAPHVRRIPGELVHAGTVQPSESATTFEGLGLAQSLADHLEAINFSTPTPIQQSAIPHLLAGRDALIKAPTGSGKTLVYLAPIVHALQGRQPRLQRSAGTHAIILAPTRELCIQISDVLALILRRYHYLGMGMGTAPEVGGAVHGGESRSNEKARLRKGVSVLVATPGRLLDHLHSTAAFSSAALTWLVLDEADRLLDLGFEAKLDEIMSILRERRRTPDLLQTVLLSATMHEKLAQLASLSLHDHVSIGFRLSDQPDTALAKSGDEEHGDFTFKAEAAEAPAGPDFSSIPAQLQQFTVEVPGKQRLAALAGLMRLQASSARGALKMLVFMSSCDSVEFHHHLLTEGYKAQLGSALLPCPIWKLHGNMTQVQRTQAFLEFGRCQQGILLCTDVAARGLDLPLVTTILQYDPPGETTEYLHRVGRTARMGKAGSAFLFLLPSEMGIVAHMESAGSTVKPQPLQPLLQALPLPESAPQGKVKTFEKALIFHQNLVKAAAADPHLKQLAADAFRSFVRAYSTHSKPLKDIFAVYQLHLGHVAHSFALSTQPTMIGKSSGKAASRSKAKQPQHKKKLKERP